jgi:L-threonylcarbamoyladenylate synthase
MKTELINANHPVAIQHATDILINGGLVVFPTDTVYGLAVLPYNEQFIERLFVVKGRERSRAIAILISGVEELEKVSKSPDATALRLARRYWPGPLTLVLPRHPILPDILSPNQTIGVRVPDHAVALSLLRMTGPLAVTSANLSGAASTTTARDALAQLDGRVHLVIDGGESPGGIPSTVVDCTTPKLRIVRQGPLMLEELNATLESEGDS